MGKSKGVPIYVNKDADSVCYLIELSSEDSKHHQLRLPDGAISPVPSVLKIDSSVIKYATHGYKEQESQSILAIEVNPFSIKANTTR